jgi:hypothetical protein
MILKFTYPLYYSFMIFVISLIFLAFFLLKLISNINSSIFSSDVFIIFKNQRKENINIKSFNNKIIINLI